MDASSRSFREETINLTLEARILQILRETQFKLLVRKVDVRNNTKGGATSVFKSKICDDFFTTKDRVINGAQKYMPSYQLLSDRINTKLSKGATQSTHRLLSID